MKTGGAEKRRMGEGEENKGKRMEEARECARIPKQREETRTEGRREWKWN